jgi:hypothetical protein
MAAPAVRPPIAARFVAVADRRPRNRDTANPAIVSHGAIMVARV